MVGGAPVTEEWAVSIGAYDFASDAPEAVETALELVGRGPEGAEAVLGA